MKHFFFLCLLIFSFAGFCQSGKTVYFGINGKRTGFDKPDIKKEIKKHGRKKLTVKTFKAADGDWMPIYTEKIKMESDSVFLIRMKGNEFSGKIRRVYEQKEDSLWKFTDWLGEKIKRTGFTTSKIPLIFEGEVTEFYPYGRIQSVSQYSNNELISNKNWLPNGERTVDDIFYSVDKEPWYEPGPDAIRKHVMETFKKYHFDFSTIEGQIIVGFVVKTDGTIDAARIIKGIAPSVNHISLVALATLEGKWIPARLNNREVNYLQVFPINFIHHDYDFETLELRGSMLYWTIN